MVSARLVIPLKVRKTAPVTASAHTSAAVWKDSRPWLAEITEQTKKYNRGDFAATCNTASYLTGRLLVHS